MKAKKHGNKYMITYRCPGIANPINEYFQNEEEANVRIAEIGLARKRGTLQPPHAKQKQLHITVAQFLNDYVSLYGLNHWSVGVLSANRHYMEHYIIPYIGNERLEDLTTLRLEKFNLGLQQIPAVSLKGREHEARKVSPSVIQKTHVLLRSTLNQAIRCGYIQNNPASVAKLPEYKKQEQTVWTEQEARHALSVCTDPILTLCMLLALGCSMQIGEILGLTWDCVHLDEQAADSYLVVEKEIRRCDKASLDDLQARGRGDVFFTFPEFNKKNCSTVLVLKTPKTQSSVRNIYIPATVVDALRKMQQEQAQNKADFGDTYLDYNMVVAQPNGRPFEERQIADKLRKLICDNDLTPVVFHSLRHCSTSIKLKLSGGDVKAVQGDTGHAQSNMVTDVYSHIMDDDRRQLAQKVERQFFHAQQDSTPAAGDDSLNKLMELLTASPEIAAPLLQMSQILSAKGM